jgi:Domain of unknown function (DUF4124)
MKFRHLLILPCLAWAACASADIYKRVDADGNVTYSNKPLKGARKIEVGPLPTLNSYDDRDAHYERVKRTTQRDRDATRRKVLEDELAAEEQLLVEARQNLKEATDAPRAPRADGSTIRDAADVEDDIKHAQDTVDLHERNINALKQELSSIR